MGTLVVHCGNRPKGEIIEVGAPPTTSRAGGGRLGWFVNGHVYEGLSGIEDTVYVGTEVSKSELQKLPHVKGGWSGRDRDVRRALAPFTGEDVSEDPPDVPGKVPEDADPNPAAKSAAKREASK